MRIRDEGSGIRVHAFFARRPRFEFCELTCRERDDEREREREREKESERERDSERVRT